MTPAIYRFLSVFVLGALFVGTAQADGMRCTRGLVERGDPAISVRHDCGAPSFVDPWGSAGVGGAGQPVPMEAWTYNRGPRRLLEIVVFRNGKVWNIRTDGYGFSVDRAGRCHPPAIQQGMSKYRLLHRCGTPGQRSGHFIFSTRFGAGGRDYYLRQGAFPVYRERWIYNFGPRKLLREVVLENATVVAIHSLNRGFDH